MLKVIDFQRRMHHFGTYEPSLNSIRIFQNSIVFPHQKLQEFVLLVSNQTNLLRKRRPFEYSDRTRLQYSIVLK